MVGLFAKKKRRTDPAEMELFSRAHRSMIQLKDSEEEKSESAAAVGGGGKYNHPKGGSIRSLGAVKPQKSFQRLGQSRSEDSSVSFDVSNQPHAAKKEPEDTTTGVGPHKTVPALKTTHKKLKLKFGGMVVGSGSSTKKFHRLENVEGSHASFAYEPPADYTSLVGTGMDVPSEQSRRLLASAALNLQQIASQSFSDYGVPPPPPEDAYVPPSSDLLFAAEPVKPPSSPNNDERPMDSDGEFRQFVFDKDFRTIEAVHVEKSDSGTGDADIFRMAAVETVARMALNQQQRNNVFSPTSGSKTSVASPLNHLPPKKSLAGAASHGAGQIKPIRKPPSPSSYSRSSSTKDDTSNAHPSDASFEDFSKQRFHELVQRTGKLRSPAGRPTPLSRPSGWEGPSKSHGATNPSSQTRPVKSMAANNDAMWHSFSNAKTHQSKTSGSRSVRSASRFTSSNHPTKPMSPLRTINHFGNQSTAATSQSGMALSSAPLPPPRRTHKAPKAISTMADFSVVSNVSIAGATVSTGPDENAPSDERAAYREFELHPYDLDDVDDPFKIAVSNAVDDAAWNVDRAPEFQTRQGRATAATKAGHASSSLIESIQKATSRHQHLRRHQRDVMHRPDPSPRGVPHSSSDSVLDFMPAQDGGRSSKQKDSQGDDAIVLSLSEGAYERETLGNARQLAAATAAANPGRNLAARSKAPSGVPENAILASMLFRQTEVFAGGPAPDRGAATPGSAAKVKLVVRTTELPKAHLEVPPTIHASSNASVVSSVTEEASSFYHKNLQQHPLKAQAHNALNNYHILRAKQSQQHQLHRLQSSSAGATNQQRRQWVSSSSSRKTASSTGRPTWLDRVEAEHMRMFTE